jgi:hypothetical protein
MKSYKIILLAIAIPGCASTTHEAKQRIMLTTPGAPKAGCKLTSKSLGVQYFTTPEAIEIPRSSDSIEISCHKKCYYDEAKIFDPVINGEDLASNGFFGGAAPLAVDVATRKYYNYQYDFVIQMKPNKHCGANRKGFLDGSSKDFDNQIKDFSYDDQNPLPEIKNVDLKDSLAPMDPITK